VWVGKKIEGGDGGVTLFGSAPTPLQPAPLRRPSFGPRRRSPYTIIVNSGPGQLIGGMSTESGGLKQWAFSLEFAERLRCIETCANKYQDGGGPKNRRSGSRRLTEPPDSIPQSQRLRRHLSCLHASSVLARIRRRLRCSGTASGVFFLTLRKTPEAASVPARIRRWDCGRDCSKYCVDIECSPERMASLNEGSEPTGGRGARHGGCD
jgi:hypothetical protein